eukprot:CAMPEP_0196575136 /NCGR_PEP_ID=MMETSP1081-20130531/4680_1 /TAXON_ID=36882 /ORGANISM="Pyramimonas amylifera, Strain CCMP720" /LENGTH=354 /DNA_ID=CAMNT_0041893339 /DNA_START=145 /DNA_END=1209 /DNA_ORIENTATION=-
MNSPSYTTIALYGASALVIAGVAVYINRSLKNAAISEYYEDEHEHNHQASVKRKFSCGSCTSCGIPIEDTESRNSRPSRAVGFPTCGGDLEEVVKMIPNVALDSQIPEVFGRIHSIESFSALDGHGIRCIVFLQGCLRRCVFCSNPDTWKTTDAGRMVSSKEIAKMIKRLVPYMKASGGGVTCSGGEPMMQAEFVAAVYQEAHELGVNTVLDTAGWGNQEDFDKVLPHTDRVMLCVKAMDPDRYTRVSGGLKQKTMLRFFKAICEKKIGLWIRLVLLPGETDNEEELRLTCEFGKTHPDFHGIELLPYHRLGQHKWEEMGIKYPMGDTPAMSEERVKWAMNFMTKEFPDVKIIR